METKEIRRLLSDGKWKGFVSEDEIKTAAAKYVEASLEYDRAASELEAARNYVNSIQSERARLRGSLRELVGPAIQSRLIANLPVGCSVLVKYGGTGQDPNILIFDAEGKAQAQ